MPKIRGVKPEFFTDEKVVSVSIAARMLLIGLWVESCDAGHVEDKPIQLKIRLYPMDDVDVNALLEELASVGLIRREGGWVVIDNLAHHQRIDGRYAKHCDKDGCEVLCDELYPERKKYRTRAGRSKTPSQKDDARSVNTDTTTGAQRAHDGCTTGARIDGDGDGDGDGDTSSELRPDVASLLDHLDHCIRNNGARVPSRSKANIDAARLILDRDKRNPDEAHRLIDWTTNDTFWRSNVLSMSKFRAKYDQLLLSAKSQQQKRQQQPMGRNQRIIAASIAERHGSAPDPFTQPALEGRIA